MRVTRWAKCLALSAAVLLPVVAAANEKATEKKAAPEPSAEEPVAEKEAAAKEAVFDLEEFSVLDTKDSQTDYEFRIGQRESCSHDPDKTVKAYPKLKSDKPWYGSIRFDRKRSDPNSGRLFHFVVDESKGLGEGYYRLHFDANQDLDLTNDPVLERMKEPPPGAAQPSRSQHSVVFDYLTVAFDHGPGLGMRPVKMMPRLVVDEYKGTEYASVSFVPTTGRRGEIQIGSRRYNLVLGHAYLVVGRFDSPLTGVHLTPIGDGQQREGWWGGDRLGAMRYADGRWYRLATTPSGDKLFVRPYEGEVGVLEMGLGNRKLDKMSITGSLRSADTAVPVGDLNRISFRPEPATRCTLPEGDYTFDSVQVEYGPLSISMSMNYHADGKPRGGMDRTPVFGIQIRKDKPFVLDFSNKPDVMFASPAKDQTFKPGDEISVAAVLIDPVLDVMIRRLGRTKPEPPPEAATETSKADTADKDANRQNKSFLDAIVEAIWGEKSKQLSATPTPRKSESLDPIVTITDSSGKEVARGKLPFG
jgi:hypothetical protein